MNEDSRAQALVAAARAGDARSLARMVSLAENGSAQLRPVMRAVAPYAGQAAIVGLTGSPGVGKSTVTGALLRAYRAAGLRVAVLAVDPTSPFSGGALLGDRVRMQDHATDPGVFIRSMATRGHLGGLSVAAPQALRILDAAGFDVICVETVGVGQAEVEIASLADTTLVILAPGLGDSIQAAKAGILESAPARRAPDLAEGLGRAGAAQARPGTGGDLGDRRRRDQAAARRAARRGAPGRPGGPGGGRRAGSVLGRLRANRDLTDRRQGGSSASKVPD